MEKILIIPDLHAPYHNKKAWKLLLKVGKSIRPDYIIILGDFVDFYAVSAHRKDPRRKLTLEDEIYAGRECLAELDKLKAKKKIFIAGNHEYRLDRYLLDNAPALAGMIGIDKALGLRKAGWKYVRYKDFLTIGDVIFTHDLDHCGRYAVYQSMSSAQASVVIGHTHRLGFAVEGDASGRTRQAFSAGWLGDAKATDYKHRVKANRDWHLGFGLGYKRGNHIHLTPVSISGNSCVVNGKFFTA